MTITFDQGAGLWSRFGAGIWVLVRVRSGRLPIELEQCRPPPSAPPHMHPAASVRRLRLAFEFDRKVKAKGGKKGKKAKEAGGEDEAGEQP